MTLGGGLPTGSGPTTEAMPRSDRIARWFEVPLLVAALLAIPVIVVQESNPGPPWEGLAAVLDWVIWGVFVLQLVVMLTVVPDRRLRPTLPAGRKRPRNTRAHADRSRDDAKAR
jgi:hypothetical protein